jgi:CBS-domain-containing membrane protein
MRDVAAGRIRCAQPQDPITTVAAIMRDDGTDAVPVINERGNVIGVVTATDILYLLARYDPKRQQR